MFRQARELRKQGFTTAVLVNRSLRSALVARLAGIRRRIGHASENRAALLTNAIPYDSGRFEAWSALDLAIPLGLPVEFVRPHLAVTEAEAEFGKAVLSGAEIGLQPGARYPQKQLPLDTTLAIAKDLQRKGHRLALLGGPEEAEDAAKVAAELPHPVVDLVGKTTIRQSLGVLTNLKAMVGSDTGLLHMAAAAGCPVVQVFGPNSAEKWGHDYPPHRVLRAPEGVMSRLPADTVIDAVCEVLGET